ncbi:XK-related protein 6 isoform X2 [Diachasma alloeum]|uniref:XK-related protein 6 isoform X2 n=1 Tax=Diachasma alloeum TaxID=454923 RepID=UPI0007382D59|nr:XK-related protein 6 isoform X2 [Diachasma alloeum]
MSTENRETERLPLDPLPLEQREKPGVNGNCGLSVLDAVFPVPNLDVDAGDIPSSRALVSEWDIFCIGLSILMHLLDCLADLNLAVNYFMRGDYAYLIWTCTFIFTPSFVNIVISIQISAQDRQNNQEDEKDKSSWSKLVKIWLLWPIILVFQLAPVLHHLDNLTYAGKSYRARKKGNQSKQKKYYLKMLKEEQDIALMRVLECFLEAAPHQALQLTIMMMHYQSSPEVNFHFLNQTLSIASSLVGMGWAMSSYHRSIRKAQWDKENISAVGNWMQFFWHFFVTISRVVAIAAAVTILPLYAGIAIVIHWLFMFIWIYLEPSGLNEFCRDRSQPPHRGPTIVESLKSHLLGMTFGLVYIFTYFKLIDGPTYWKHAIYYSLCFGENVVAAVSWIFLGDDLAIIRWYYELVPATCIAPFILGIVVMIVYYKGFHPSMKNMINRIDQPTEENSRQLAI